MQNLSYRDILQNELDFRVSQNAAYSLRSFAKDLSISASQLSDILKSKKGMSAAKSLEVASAMGLNLNDSLLFKALVEIEHARCSKTKKLAKKFIEANQYKNSFRLLNEEAFSVISEWYHFAILSCMELDSYDGSLDFLMNKLGLDEGVTIKALRNMISLGMVIEEDKEYRCTGEMYQTTNDIESNALKLSHKNSLINAVEKIDSVAVELRDISSITMAIDLDKVKEAKEKILSFRRELCKFLESDKKDEVYELNIQLFPLSRVQA